MNIVPMTEENYKAAAKIAAENLAEAWSEQTYFKQLSNSNDTTYLAQEDGVYCGFLSLWYVLDEIEINNIAVSKDFRRRGIAAQLLKRMENDFPQAVSCVLEVRESNIPAISLYESFGFKAEGKRKNFYSAPTENAVIMVKRYQNT